MFLEEHLFITLREPCQNVFRSWECVICETSLSWSEGDFHVKRAVVRASPVNNCCHWGSEVCPAEHGAKRCQENMLSCAVVSTMQRLWAANTKWEVKGGSRLSGDPTQRQQEEPNQKQPIMMKDMRIWPDLEVQQHERFKMFAKMHVFRILNQLFWRESSDGYNVCYSEVKFKKEKIIFYAGHYFNQSRNLLLPWQQVDEIFSKLSISNFR